MSAQDANSKDIKALQRMAQNAPNQPRRSRVKPASRAAQLAAIDILSRWSAAGLAVIAGLGVYLSITVGRTYHGRAAAWAFMLLCALWVARRMQSEFRSGTASAAHPFRWRASFAASLLVLGVAFASAPILLTPSTAPGDLQLQTALLVIAGTFGAAIFFAAHLNSAAAILMPGIVFSMAAALREASVNLGVFYMLASAASLAALLFIHRRIAQRLSRQHPRTSFLRTELETPKAGNAYAGADRQTA